MSSTLGIKNRVVFFLLPNILQSSIGGAEKQAKMIIDQLAETGHYSIKVLAFQSSKQGGEACMGAKCQVVSLRHRFWERVLHPLLFISIQTDRLFSSKAFVQKYGRPIGIYGLLLAWYYKKCVNTYCKKNKVSPDIIQTFTVEWVSMAAWYIGKRFRARVIIRDSTMNGIEKLSKNCIGRLSLPYIKRDAEFIAISSDIHKQMVAHAIAMARVHIIPNGIGRSGPRRAIHSSTPKALFVGNLYQHPAKGIDLLLKAWKAVIDKYPDAELNMLGEGEVGQWENESRKIGVENNVLWRGYQNPIDAYYDQCHVFILPSRREGMSNALIEAMLKEMPVIASRISGNTDLIEDGVSGLLFQAENPAQLADCITFMLEHPEEAMQMGKKARQSILANNDINVIAEKFNQLYISQ